MLNLPADFLAHAKAFMGNEYESFIRSLEMPATVSIRKNPFKPENVFPHAEPIPWSVEGRHLDSRPSFTLDPFFHAGCYYVQDASSQFLETAFLQAKKNFDRPVRVLDLCAAPGGKSTHLLSMLEASDIVVSNEIIPSRNNILRQNIVKWGVDNIIVTQNESASLAALTSLFDIIVVDAPCSGEGLFRKDKSAIGEWSKQNVQMCASRQNEILDHAVKMLRPGGFIIYSTCTFEKSENDDQVERLAEKHKLTVNGIRYDSQQIVRTSFGLSFYPHRVRGEGFYISLLQKTAGDDPVKIKTARHEGELSSEHKKYLANGNDFSGYIKEDNVFAIRKTHFDFFNHLKNTTYVRLAGIHLGQKKGKDFIPSEALALSVQLSAEVPAQELSLEESLHYLRGNPVHANAANGFAVVKYKKIPLGWIKKIGNRVNNYYPKEWRIKTL